MLGIYDSFFVFVCVGSVCLGVIAARESSRAIGIFVTLALIRCAVDLFITQNKTVVASAMAFMIGVSFVFSLQVFKNMKSQSVESLILTIGLAGIPGMIWNAAVGEHSAFLIPNAGMCGVLVVACLPFALKRQLYISALVFGLTVFLTDSSTSVASLVVCLSVYGLYRVPKLLFFVPVVLIAAGLFTEGLFDDSQRFARWANILHHYPISPILGTGPGTFSVIGPLIERSTEGRVDVMQMLHNDYIQLFLEYGVVGCVLFFFILVGILRKAIHRPELVASIASICTASLTYYPAHDAWFILLSAMLVSLTNREVNTNLMR